MAHEKRQQTLISYAKRMQLWERTKKQEKQKKNGGKTGENDYVSQREFKM